MPNVPERLVQRPWYTRLRDLMPFRVREILLVSSAYDAFILEEDGPLTERLFTQYSELELTSSPRITHATSSTKALRMLAWRSFDLVIVMPRLRGTDALTMARQAKERQSQVPVVMLTFSEADLAQFPEGLEESAIDHVFLWTGDARILITIAKVIEDIKNLEHDTTVAGVPGILVVEDSIHNYSSFLTALYSELFSQSQSVIADGVNNLHRRYQMRARPKVIHATNYEQAIQSFREYQQHIVAVITDGRFARNRQHDRTAGLNLIQAIQRESPTIPILLQSSNPEVAALAAELGVAWLDKASPTVLRELRQFVSEGLGFGDFVFRLPDRTELARAHDLFELEGVLQTVPGQSLAFHAKRHDFSVWFAARGLLDVARIVRANRFTDPEATRAYILKVVRKVVAEERTGTIADFAVQHMQPAGALVRLGAGSIGGKARGIAFANSVLVKHDLQNRFEQLPIRIPRSLVIGADEFVSFMETNEITEDLADLTSDEAILQRFLAGRLPESLEADLHSAWRNLKGPLAVRSSSMLEDLQFQPFSGVYATYMLPNNHPNPNKRFREFCRAIKAVYASTYCANARTYLESTPFRQDEERMGIVVQELVGKQRSGRFYPHISGVALSYNYYPIKGQKPEDGTVLLAVGLGETIVAGGTVLRFSPRSPGVQPQFTCAEDYLRLSQKSFYALDMTRSTLDFSAGPESSLVKESVGTIENDGLMAQLGSVFCAQDDTIRENARLTGPRVITFNNILKWNALPLPEALDAVLRHISKGMGCAVEIEFTVDMDDDTVDNAALYVLQIRPLATQFRQLQVTMEETAGRELLCRTDRALGHGVLRDVRDVVYIKPDALETQSTRELAAQVGKLTTPLRDQRAGFMLVGPGRWGTSDASLGIPVEWRQIAGARLIAEVPLRGYPVEPSQGTHFFQNITSLNIGYLTVSETKAEDESANFIDLDWLEQQPTFDESPGVRHVRFARPLHIFLDGRTSTATILKPDHEAKSEDGEAA